VQVHLYRHFCPFVSKLAKQKTALDNVEVVDLITVKLFNVE